MHVDTLQDPCKYSMFVKTNGVTAFVDGGVIYGNAQLWTDQLRNSAGNNGTLLVNGSDILSSFPETNHKQLPLSNHPPPRDHSLKSATRLFGNNIVPHTNIVAMVLSITYQISGLGYCVAFIKYSRCGNVYYFLN